MLSAQETNISPIESQENTMDVQVKEEVIQANTSEDSGEAGVDTEEADEESVNTMEEIGEETVDTGENEDGDESEEEQKNEQQEKKWRKLKKGNMLKRHVHLFCSVIQLSHCNGMHTWNLLLTSISFLLSFKWVDANIFLIDSLI